ncbi:unnamed protein product [Parnassius apollo]|uniref:(apollo) hypothetical protein n=1 Tax=Parnassius apollo TaxID=110799 RepID=A0A8S3W661_PARAO|nr:unnamed protein product [Parnassius apollo]
MSFKVYIVGVGMTNFVKPNTAKDYPKIGKEAVEEALADSGVSYDAVQQAVCGYVYGDSTCGQRVLYQLGMTGIPIYNVHNHGATGATALYLAYQLVQGGLADVVLAVGFEKMLPGTLPGTAYPERTYPLDKHVNKMLEMVQIENAPLTAQCFGNAGLEHMKKYGTTQLHFAKIAFKNHQNGSRNPRALSQKAYTLDEILNSKKIFGPLTKLQCCSNSDGAAAAILMSEKAVAYYNLHEKAVEILGMAMATDTEDIFIEKSVMKVTGYDMSALAAKKVYAKSGISPKQIDVVELHDCFSCNELITYESLQLCGEGKGGEFVDAGDNTYGGKVVVNPSGGLIAKGNPIGATGLAQCAELVWQLRGEAGRRQVPNARIGLQHNLGLGGAVVVAVYRRGFDSVSSKQISTIYDNPESFKVYKYIKILEEVLKTTDKGLIEKVRGVYGIKVLNGPNRTEGYWIINTKVGKGNITYKSNEKPDVILTGSDQDIVDIVSGKMDCQKAYFRGNLNVQGNMTLAKKLQKLLAGTIKSVRAKI